MTNQGQTVPDRIRGFRILPVIVIEDAERAVPLGDALCEAGLPVAEITFRTGSARESIRRMKNECPNVLLGAGTVLTATQVDEARDAGAEFIVAPGLSTQVVERSLELQLPVFPGVCTPTEIERALRLGLSVVKFFPAEPMGGVKFLRAVSAPYSGVRFMPTGGITADNVRTYLDFDRVIACGGSWMAPSDRISAGDFDFIRTQTAAAVKLVGSSTPTPAGS
jgi:2-dehydro-3-deoxyphosphogluconate aldolase/(4S)-4-hydroxy-2-oxoglutarate aldolase